MNSVQMYMTTLSLFVLTSQYFILLIHVPGLNASKEGKKKCIINRYLKTR